MEWRAGSWSGPSKHHPGQQKPSLPGHPTPAPPGPNRRPPATWLGPGSLVGRCEVRTRGEQSTFHPQPDSCSTAYLITNQTQHRQSPLPPLDRQRVLRVARIHSATGTRSSGLRASCCDVVLRCVTLAEVCVTLQRSRLQRTTLFCGDGAVGIRDSPRCEGPASVLAELGPIATPTLLRSSISYSTRSGGKDILLHRSAKREVRRCKVADPCWIGVWLQSASSCLVLALSCSSGSGFSRGLRSWRVIGSRSSLRLSTPRASSAPQPFPQPFTSLALASLHLQYTLTQHNSQPFIHTLSSLATPAWSQSADLERPSQMADPDDGEFDFGLWCPICDKQIEQPELAPEQAAPSLAPAPSPSLGGSSHKPKRSNSTHSKAQPAHRRSKSSTKLHSTRSHKSSTGLHGLTASTKIKDNASSGQPSPPPSPAIPDAAVLGQQSSLYCSDECRRVDEMRSRLAFAHLGPNARGSVPRTGGWVEPAASRVPEGSARQSAPGPPPAMSRSYSHGPVQSSSQPSLQASRSYSHASLAGSARADHVAIHHGMATGGPAARSQANSTPALDFSTRRMSRGSETQAGYSFRPSMMQRMGSSEHEGLLGRAARGSSDALSSMGEHQPGTSTAAHTCYHELTLLLPQLSVRILHSPGSGP